MVEEKINQILFKYFLLSCKKIVTFFIKFTEQTTFKIVKSIFFPGIVHDINHRNINECEQYGKGKSESGRNI